MYENSDFAKETRDRTLRIETKLTKLAEQLGVYTGSARPRWDEGSIYLPSPACSIKDCLDVIPRTWDREVEIDVYCINDRSKQCDYIMSFFMTQTS